MLTERRTPERASDRVYANDAAKSAYRQAYSRLPLGWEFRVSRLLLMGHAWAPMSHLGEMCSLTVLHA
jgi:hypothetical protein